MPVLVGNPSTTAKPTKVRINYRRRPDHTCAANASFAQQSLNGKGKKKALSIIAVKPFSMSSNNSPGDTFLLLEN
jgi:hypothetical protein